MRACARHAPTITVSAQLVDGGWSGGGCADDGAMFYVIIVRWGADGGWKIVMSEIFDPCF